MTEAEWLVCMEPVVMLAWGLQEHAGAGPQLGRPRFTARTMRLFACACWRQIWPHFPTQIPGHWRRAADWAESFADGEADGLELPLLVGTWAGRGVHDLSLEPH